MYVDITFVVAVVAIINLSRHSADGEEKSCDRLTSLHNNYAKGLFNDRMYRSKPNLPKELAG